MKCRNYDRGCTNTVPLENIDLHEEKCGYEQNFCRYTYFMSRKHCQMPSDLTAIEKAKYQLSKMNFSSTQQKGFKKARAKNELITRMPFSRRRTIRVTHRSQNSDRFL